MSLGRLPNLVLTGFMGTGKSTVGRIVAHRLGREFVDTDDMVERQAGMSIKDIFHERGEAAFRALEQRACHQAAEMSCAVISVGGGALLDPQSRRVMEHMGIILLLSCERETLVERLRLSAQGGDRPLLVGNFTRQIEELLEARRDFYSSFPLQVDTTHLTADEVADRVLALYRQAIPESAHA